jgi:hypothetical protein
MTWVDPISISALSYCMRPEECPAPGIDVVPSDTLVDEAEYMLMNEGWQSLRNNKLTESEWPPKQEAFTKQRVHFHTKKFKKNGSKPP